MKINYFDMGLYNGEEINMMIKIFTEMNIKNYNVYGFEAHPLYFKQCFDRYSANSKIKIIHAAICSTNKNVNLYISNNQEGHSIYRSKKNILPSGKNILVKGIVFSEWIEKNISDFKSSFNILRANIEGAEWDLLNNLIYSEIYKYISVYCGCWYDVEKVLELKNVVDDFKNKLCKYNIVIHRFSYYKPSHNEDMKKIISEKLNNCFL